MPFKTRLSRLRKSANLSRTQLATAAGLSREAVRLLENGDREPTVATLVKLGKALGVEWRVKLLPK